MKNEILDYLWIICENIRILHMLCKIFRVLTKWIFVGTF